MTSRQARSLAGVTAELARTKAKMDSLLDVINAVCLAYGNGPECRIAVSNAYVGKRRREVIIEAMRGERFIVYLAPVTQEEPDGDAQDRG